jgi:maltose-binding protein MalE
MFKHFRVAKLVFILILTCLVLGAGAVIAQDEQTLTISFPGDPRSETVNALIDGFVSMKADEGVTVNVVINEPTEGYTDQLLLDFSADVGPDVFSVSADFLPDLVGAEVIMPLDDLLSEWADWDNFPQGMKEMPAYNGATYAVMGL